MHGADRADPARTPRVPRERLLAELVPPPRFAHVSFDSYEPDPAQPSQAEAVDRMRGCAGRVGGVHREAAGGGWSRPVREEAARRGLPRRRVRRRQDPPARVAVARRPGAQAVRHVRRADPPGGGAGLPPRGRRAVVVPRWSASTSSSSTTPATRCWSPRCSTRLRDAGVSGWRRPRTRCPAGWGRAASPPPTSCARSRGSAALRARCASTARTTATAASPRPPPARTDDERGASRPGVPARASTTSSTCTGTWPTCTPPSTAPCSTVSRPSAWRTCAPSTTRPSHCGWWCSPTGCTTATSPVVASGVTFDRLFAPALLEGGYRKKYHRAVSRLVALAREGAGMSEAARTARSGMMRQAKKSTQPHSALTVPRGGVPGRASTPAATPGFDGGKTDGQGRRWPTWRTPLSELQERLFAAGRAGARPPAGAAGAAGHGHRRQGRRDAARGRPGRPAGCAHQGVQGPDRGGAGRTTSCGGSSRSCRSPA